MSWRRLFALPRRSRERIASDVDDELATHLAMREADLVASGLGQAEARAQARREFGDLEAARRHMRASDLHVERRRRLFTWLGEARSDARFALRQTVRAPAASLLAILALVVGIGASTAIYSVVYGVLFAPLPFADADQIVVLKQFDRQIGAAIDLAPMNFTDWRDRSRSFAHAAIAEPYGMDLTGSGEAARLDTWNVTTGFFEVLGVAPLLGRTFTPAEHETGAGRAVVLGHRAWLQRFGADSTIIGRTLTLDEQTYTVIGVMGPRFSWPEPADAYAPRALPGSDGGRSNRVSTYLSGVARLKPGVSLEQAQQEGDAIAADLAALYPQSNRQMGARVVRLYDHLTGRVRGAMLVLLGAVLAVLLIASTNVTNLLLARGAVRQREFALRAALGAGRGRLARQLLVETAVLAAAGLAGGLALASGGVGVLVRLAPAELPRLDEIHLRLPVVAFALALAGAATLIAGLVPALQQSRAEAGGALRSTAGPGRGRLAAGFVAGQVAMALVLLIGAGLLFRSYTRLLREDLGFRPEGTLAATMHIWDRYPDPAARGAFVDQLLERLAALPGVGAVAAANALPLSQHGSDMDPPFLVEGQPAPAPGDEPTAVLTLITPGYFDALGIRVLRGRPPARSDDAAAAPVAVIGAALAERYFPDVDPVGRQIVTIAQDRRTTRTVVGVVADVRHSRLDEAPRPEIYLPVAQRPFGSLTIVVRADRGDAAALAPAVQAVAWSLSPGLLFDGVERLDQRLADTLAPRRFTLALVALFAAVALLLALIGVYGAMSVSVSQRTAEIGIRMSLGADARRIARQVVREAVVIAGIGTVAGAAAAAALTRGMQGLLFGVSPTDPLTFVAIAMLMLATAALAAWVPASRAARVDPASAMRIG